MSISCNLKHLVEGNPSKKDTGLGNTLFQIATQYALSKKYNFKMNVNELGTYCNILKQFGFGHEQTIFRKFLEKFDKEPQSNFVMISEEKYKEEICDNNFLNDVQKYIGQNIKINGYFQSFIYFNEFRDDLIDLFAIDEFTLYSIFHRFPILLDTNTVCVSLHIRMNYANCINYNFNFFEEAINYFKSRFTNLHFLVMSNNIESASLLLNNKNINYTIVNSENDYCDVWIMSLCKHNIITHSTFSWWGAYLNNKPDKIVIYPLDALKIFWGQLYPEYICKERQFDHYLPNWIPLNTNTLERY